MHIYSGDYVNTPRFLRVRIRQIFPSVDDLRDAGYTEPTHFKDGTYEVSGKCIGNNEMLFAAAYKVARPVRYVYRCPVCKNTSFVRRGSNCQGEPLCVCTACGKLHELKSLDLRMELADEEEV